MAVFRSLSLAVAVAWLAACGADQLGSEGSAILAVHDARVVVEADGGGSGAPSHDAQIGLPDAGVGGPIVADAGLPVDPPIGPPMGLDAGYPVPPYPPYPDAGNPIPPYPPYPDAGITIPPYPDAGIPDAPIVIDAGIPDAPPPDFCVTTDADTPCTGTCACQTSASGEFGTCIENATSAAPDLVGSLAIDDDPDTRACNAAEVYDTLVCENGPSWVPPPASPDVPELGHYDVHHDHNHTAHAGDSGSYLLDEGAEHDVCAWCVADPADVGAARRAMPAADGCTPLPAPTSPAEAAKTLQCLWDQGKGWEDAKKAFPADVALLDKSNLHLARKKIVDDIIAIVGPAHKVLTGVSGTEAAASDVDVSVQYKELCAESNVAEAIKQANAEFAKKVTKYPMTMGRALDVNFYFAREIPIKGMTDNPPEIAASETQGDNPANLERLHEVAATVKAREYMKGTSWGAFRAKFDKLLDGRRKYQDDEILKGAERYYAEVDKNLSTQFKTAVKDRNRARAPYDAAKDANDLKVAAKITLYETALGEVQKIRNQRLATVVQLKAAAPAGQPALLTKLRTETYQYEEAVVKSSFYADQAYYARGSLLVVVASSALGGQGASVKAGWPEPTLTTAHYFQSTIEQTGDLFKDLGHAVEHKWLIGQTGIKSSKYALRFFDGAIATLNNIRPALKPADQADADKLIKALTDAKAVNGALYTVRRSGVAYDATQEAAAVITLKQLGIRDIGDFRSRYREWCAKVIIFKRLSEAR